MEFSRGMVLSMEHPIPQNVTSFEFHLVGDMTLKQFLFLAGGLGFSYFVFIFLFPLNPILAIPLILILAGGGTTFAFVPILDRPLDHWVMAFFKAVYSPTKGFWQTASGVTPNEPFLKNRLRAYLSPKTIPTLTRIPTPQPTPADLEKLVEVAKQAQTLHQQIAQIPDISPIRPHQAQVVVVEPLKQPQTQLTLTSLPNVINGVIIDDSGSPIEGVIIIIHNTDGIPVRASKTNKLGQFAGATSLPSGVYTITLEKENFEFDTLQVTLNTAILSPLMIKPKKHDQ